MKKALITSTVEPIYLHRLKGLLIKSVQERGGEWVEVQVIKSKAWHEPVDMTVTLSRKE